MLRSSARFHKKLSYKPKRRTGIVMNHYIYISTYTLKVHIHVHYMNHYIYMSHYIYMNHYIYTYNKYMFSTYT